jgi:hypothetical protein
MENHHAINGKIHYNWPFSIAMLVYQRVRPFLDSLTWLKEARKKLSWKEKYVHESSNHNTVGLFP